MTHARVLGRVDQYCPRTSAPPLARLRRALREHAVQRRDADPELGCTVMNAEGGHSQLFVVGLTALAQRRL